MTGSKKEQRDSFNKACIAKAASALFEEHSVASVKIEDIAKAAGLSKTTVYAYFKSKDDIIYFITLQSMERVRMCVEKVGRGNGSIVEHVRFLFYDLLELCEGDPFAYQCLLAPIPIDKKSREKNPVLEDIYQAGEALGQAGVALIEKGIAQGVFRGDLLALPTAFIFQVHIFGVVLLANNKQAYIEETMMPRDAFVEYAVNQLLYSVLSEEHRV